MNGWVLACRPSMVQKYCCCVSMDFDCARKDICHVIESDHGCESFVIGRNCVQGIDREAGTGVAVGAILLDIQLVDGKCDLVR